MPSTEQLIKDQYAKFFTVSDWPSFKALADYYFKNAAFLKKVDIDSDVIPELRIRNIQKRLYLGIGAELLVKAFYLKNGYGINTPKVGSWTAYKIESISSDDFNNDNTVTMNSLLQEMVTNRVSEFTNEPQIVKGLKIAKVFRNKEGHVVTVRHSYASENYIDIERAVIDFYMIYFQQTLNFKISMESNQKPYFDIELT